MPSIVLGKGEESVKDSGHRPEVISHHRHPPKRPLCQPGFHENINSRCEEDVKGCKRTATVVTLCVSGQNKKS